MLTRLILQLLLMLVSTSPALARDAANPDAGVPPAHYSPVVSGTKSYRPVEPLPWGEINRRVMPPEPGKAEPKGKQQEKAGAHGQR